jgi:hypothetical protein
VNGCWTGGASGGRRRARGPPSAPGSPRSWPLGGRAGPPYPPDGRPVAPSDVQTVTRRPKELGAGCARDGWRASPTSKRCGGGPDLGAGRPGVRGPRHRPPPIEACCRYPRRRTPGGGPPRGDRGQLRARALVVRTEGLVVPEPSRSAGRCGRRAALPDVAVAGRARRPARAPSARGGVAGTVRPGRDPDRDGGSTVRGGSRDRPVGPFGARPLVRRVRRASARVAEIRPGAADRLAVDPQVRPPSASSAPSAAPSARGAPARPEGRCGRPDGAEPGRSAFDRELEALALPDLLGPSEGAAPGAVPIRPLDKGDEQERG